MRVLIIAELDIPGEEISHYMDVYAKVNRELPHISNQFIAIAGTADTIMHVLKEGPDW